MLRELERCAVMLSMLYFFDGRDDHVIYLFGLPSPV